MDYSRSLKIDINCRENVDQNLKGCLNFQWMQVDRINLEKSLFSCSHRRHTKAIAGVAITSVIEKEGGNFRSCGC